MDNVPAASADVVRMWDSASTEKSMFTKIKMKRNEEPIMQNSLNKAVQACPVQQTNDPQPHENNIMDSKAESRGCEKIHFLGVGKRTCLLKRISWIKPKLSKKISCVRI